MAAILSRAFSCKVPCPIRSAEVIRKSREGLPSGSMSSTRSAEGFRLSAAAVPGATPAGASVSGRSEGGRTVPSAP